MSVQLRSIDLIGQPCYFKVKVVDVYGRPLTLNNATIRLYEADREQSSLYAYTLTGVDKEIRIWIEDVRRVTIEDDCIQTLDIDITEDNYFNGEDLTVTVLYNDAVDINAANNFNYIRWNIAYGSVPYPFGGVEPTNFNDRALACTGCKAIPLKMANPYLTECGIYRPVVSECDETKFYTNIEGGIDAKLLGAVKLDIIDTEYNTILTDVATVQANLVSGSFVNFYAEDIKPTGLTDCKTYMFVLYDADNGNAIAISNEWVYFVDDDKLNEVTSLVEYRASQNMYYFDYDSLPNFKNQIRLHLHRMAWQPENTTEQYQEETTGLFKNFFSTPNKYWEVRTYFFDDEAHEATVVFCEHDEISINKVDYTVKTKHSLEENPRENTHNGGFELYEKDFSTVNKTC